MKKYLSLCALLVWASFTAARDMPDTPAIPGSPQKITVTYKGESEALTPFERGLAEFNDMRYYEVHLDGKRTLTSLVEVVCRGGAVTENVILPEVFSVTGVGTLRFYAQGVSADSVKILIRTDGGMGMPSRVVQLPNDKHYILMETYDAEGGAVIPGESAGDFSVDYAPGAAVPLIAYTTGLRKEIEFDGIKGTMIDLCGLRDKHVHPSRWGEFGVDNYVYYVAKFE